MHVTVEVVGGGTHEVDLADGTYADLLDAVGMNRHEATVLVDGTPVPEDQSIEATDVEVLRLIEGG